VLIIGLPFSNSIIEIAATTAIILWIFKKVKKAFILRNLKLLKPENTSLNTPILFYLIFVALSLINTQFLITSLKGFFFKTLEHFLLFFVIVETVKTKKDLKKIVSAIIFSCLIIGIDCLWQRASGYDFLRGYPLISLRRVTASFKFPNGFGGWLITVIPLTISLVLFNTKEKLWKICCLSLSILLLVCLFLSFARGAWMGLLFAIAFLMWRKREVAKKILILLLIVVILSAGLVIILGNKEVLSRYFSYRNAIIHRVFLARLCWRMFIDHPLLGHGINTFMSIYEIYKDKITFEAPPTHVSAFGISYAHNCYLQIAVETGIFSLLAFLWMIVMLFVSSLKDINRRKEGFIKAVQIGLLAGLLAYLAHSAVETNLYALQLAILFYYFLGVAISIQKIKEV
jgi:O-antigen ligase